MSKNKGALTWKSASGVGGLSTMAIAIIQSGVIDLTAQEISLYTTITPIISTAFVTFLIWVFAHLGLQTTSRIVAETQVDNQIKYLETKLAQNKQAGNDFSELQKQLNKAYISKSNLAAKTMNDILSSE